MTPSPDPVGTLRHWSADSQKPVVIGDSNTEGLALQTMSADKSFCVHERSLVRTKALHLGKIVYRSWEL
jgi:hypothetical protein